jgi:Fe-S cluster assembly protein SufD
MVSQNTYRIPARISAVRIQRALRTERFDLSRDASLVLCLCIKKGSKHPAHITINLNGERARAHVFFVFVGRGSAALGIRILIHHRAPTTIARFWGRSILFDSARLDISGTHIIDASAQAADTYFSHHALLLSRNASARAVPSLEIHADDVRAGHAATTAPMSPEAFEYLRARGIPKSDGARLMVRGFLRADSGHLSDASIRTAFEKVISETALI